MGWPAAAVRTIPQSLSTAQILLDPNLPFNYFPLSVGNVPVYQTSFGYPVVGSPDLSVNTIQPLQPVQPIQPIQPIQPVQPQHLPEQPTEIPNDSQPTDDTPVVRIPQPQFPRQPQVPSFIPKPNNVPTFVNNNAEPTTTPAAPINPTPKPEKLIASPELKTNQIDMKPTPMTVTDISLTQAKQLANSRFIIEGIYPIPGQRVQQLVSHENFLRTKQSGKTEAIKSSLVRQPSNIRAEITQTGGAKLPLLREAKDPVILPPYIRVGDRNLPTTSLILEPLGRAIAGNDGVAIAAPISHAYLKKGIPTAVFFRPQTVAIAGAGGKAHAHADLIIEYEEDK